jgi:hypothetical protein
MHHPGLMILMPGNAHKDVHRRPGNKMALVHPMVDYGRRFEIF